MFNNKNKIEKLMVKLIGCQTALEHEIRKNNKPNTLQIQLVNQLYEIITKLDRTIK